MLCGCLAPSCDAEEGHRYFAGAPGVYMHKDKTAHKADNYTRFSPLCDDGVFWATKWELRVDRTRRVIKNDTDQWVQREDSVRLVALWLCGRRHEEMTPGEEFSEAWNPMLEASPVPTQSSPGCLLFIVSRMFFCSGPPLYW